MPVMSKELEQQFLVTIKRIIENKYEDDKIHLIIMDLKHKVLLEMLK